MKGKVCVISGSRAEYGILKLIMRKIKANTYTEIIFLETNLYSFLLIKNIYKSV